MKTLIQAAIPVSLQIACFLILIFLMITYYSFKREHILSYKLFLAVLWSAFINYIFDIMTVYMVSDPFLVTTVFNRFAHNIFISSLIIFIYCLSLYDFELMGSHIISNIKKWAAWTLLFLLMVVYVFAMPLYYIKTSFGSYSYGPATYAIFAAIVLYCFSVIITLIKKWNDMEKRKRSLIIGTLLLFILFYSLQIYVPELLITSAGIMFNIVVIYIFEENSDRLLQEKYLHEKEKADKANRAKSEFLANVSHEIRTPLNAIIGLDEIILKEYSQEQLLEYAVDIKNASQTLLVLVNNILDMSKIEEGKMEINPVEYELAGMLNDLLTMISVRAEAKKLKLKEEIDATIPKRLFGDEMKLKQILINIMSNAVKYTEHGSVTLRMTWQPLDGEMIALLIEVEDTGAGIKEEDIPKIYEKFQRIDIEKNRNIEGTGLGMTITAQFVKMMDGEIRVRSQYGSGTCFDLKIPQKIRSQEVIGSIQKSRERELAELKRDRVTFTAPKARILVVDDNEINLKVFEGLLRKTQIHIETAESGAECLKLTEEQTYDLIFMDHMMPQMDGIEAFRRLKAQDTGKCRETPVIALTANAIVGAREEYIAEGFTDYLSKPIDGIRLREMLLRYLPKQLIIKI